MLLVHNPTPTQVISFSLLVQFEGSERLTGPKEEAPTLAPRQQHRRQRSWPSKMVKPVVAMDPGTGGEQADVAVALEKQP